MCAFLGGVNMHKRVNVTLPESTVALIDRAAKNGNRSRFIDHAVKSYIRQKEKEQLRERLERGAIKRAERDLKLAQEWFAVEEETWRRNKK